MLKGSTSVMSCASWAMRLSAKSTPVQRKIIMVEKIIKNKIIIANINSSIICADKFSFLYFLLINLNISSPHP